jgi:hypothetical protein
MKLLATFRRFAKVPKKKDITVCDVRQASNKEYCPPAVPEPAGILNNKKSRNYSHFEGLICPVFNSPLTSGSIQEI